MNSIALYGFTLLRNGVKYDYCFRESLLSLSYICREVYLALGKSEDGTENAVKDFDFLQIIPTHWDEQLREGGLILSQQTNVALNALRAAKRDEKEAWGFYLQCDEVIHEDDRELIWKDVQRAEEQGYDAISFRYLHFWKDHHHIAINKKWYPQEIRAVKLNSLARSWGDAQSFVGQQRVYESEARIFHYGHVREQDKYKNKKEDILKLYHRDEKLLKYQRREKRFDDATETLAYFGPQPRVMKERMEAMGDLWTLPKRRVAYIVGDKSELDEKSIAKIWAEKTIFVSRPGKVPVAERDHAVVLNPRLWDKILRRDHVPSKMRSKLARKWGAEFMLTLKLSAKEISQI